MEWISVKDSLPSGNRKVLVTNEVWWWEGRYYGGNWYDSDDHRTGVVTYWMDIDLPGKFSRDSKVLSLETK